MMATGSHPLVIHFRQAGHAREHINLQEKQYSVKLTDI